MTQEQYDRELAAGNIDETALYLTPDSGIHIASKTGESPVLNDSAAGGLKIDRICGVSKQETTSGNQLLDAGALSTTTITGITCEVLDDGGIHIEGTKASGDWRPSANKLLTLANGTYVLSHEASKGKLARIRLHYDSDVYRDYGKGEPFVIDGTEREISFMVQVEPNWTVNETIYPMLNAGTEALPWEPYTGGIPSPNPEYPQPIVSAGQKLVDGVVTDVGISKKLTGKNLLQNTAVSQTVNGVTFTVNEDGTVVANGTATKNVFFTIGKIYVLETEEYIISGSAPGSHNGTTHIYSVYYDADVASGNGWSHAGESRFIPATTGEVNCNIFIREGATITNGIFKPMVRHSFITDDTYEPYTEQTLTLNHVLRGIPLGTDIPEMFKSNALHMDGIYWDEKEQQYYIADTIDAERGVLVQRVGTMMLDGSDDEGWTSQEGTTLGIRYLLKNTGFMNSDTSSSVAHSMNTNFELGGNGHTYSRPNCYTLADGSLYVSLNGTETLDEFKTYLSNKPMTVDGILATPIETPLTDEEIIALHQLKTYQGVTHIFGSNDPDATMIFKYSSSEIGGVTLENSNLHAVNEVLRGQMLTHSDVVDNLTSTDTDVPLSANQGRVLKDELDDLKDEIPDVLPINKGGTGATDAATALANLGGAKASETIKTAFYDDAAENIGQLLDAKCAHARELNAPAVCIYGGWQNIDFGVFYAQVVNNVVQGIYVKGDTAYIVRCDNGTDTATYSKVALQSDIDEDIPYKVVIDDTAGTIDFIDR